MSLIKPLHFCAAARAAMLALLLGASPASAQSIFFDWGSNENVDAAGREIVSFNPSARLGELIVSFGDRRVYYIIGPGKALSYPIAVPREKSKWQGVTNVSMKKVSPSWTPTPEMIRENPRLPPWVPGGHPMNPLGTHALYLGSSSYRIHGTDAPWTIGTAASKGCVRMYNKDVQDLYPRVPVGTRVTVTYQTYKSSPLDGDSAKGVLATFDKGIKSKPRDGYAAQDGAATKKAQDETAASETTKTDDGEARDGDNDSGTASRRTRDKPKQTAEKNNTEKSVDATVDSDRDEQLTASSNKRASDKRAVETGSVGKNDDTLGKRNAAPGTAKPVDDATAMAQRALAAAERAAAAAERAADAAERVSAAVIKQHAAAAPARVDPTPDAQPKALDAWPVVKSEMSWPVVR